MGLSITLNDVDCTGISQLTAEDIQQAKEQHCHWKLIGTVEGGSEQSENSEHSEHYTASVKPELLSKDHPLASISGATNAITYSTDLIADITLVGPGAGRIETGYAVIEDILAVHRTG